MKKILSIFLIITFLMAPCAMAAFSRWHPANQVTVTWDIVTSGLGIIKYRVYLQKVDMLGNHIENGLFEMGITEPNSIIITMPEEGGYIVGVQAVLFVDNVETKQSTISWSDDPATYTNTDLTTFGILYVNVNDVKNISVNK